jgi:hypothetical protein
MIDNKALFFANDDFFFARQNIAGDQLVFTEFVLKSTDIVFRSLEGFDTVIVYRPCTDPLCLSDVLFKGFINSLEDLEAVLHLLKLKKN